MSVLKVKLDLSTLCSLFIMLYVLIDERMKRVGDLLLCVVFCFFLCLQYYYIVCTYVQLLDKHDDVSSAARLVQGATTEVKNPMQDAGAPG